MLLTSVNMLYAQQKSSAEQEWVITVDSVDPSNYAGVTVANGMIGLLSSPNPFEVKNIVLAGTFDTHGRGMVSNFLKSFNLLNMFMEVDKHRIGVGNVTNMKQELNLQKAFFKSSFDFEDKATISVTYRSLRHLPFTVLMDVEVQAHKGFVMNTGSILNTPSELKDIQNYFTEITVPETTLPLMSSIAMSPSGKLTLAAANTFDFYEEAGAEPRVYHERMDNNQHHIRFSKQLKKGEQYRFSVVGSLVSSVYQEDALNEAQRMTIFAALKQTEQLIEAHEKAWSELWSTGDIILKGDPVVQKDMRIMLYHLYSFVREGFSNSLSPMGLSGLGYNGHVFWDTEIWMFPPLLVLQPNLAKSLINYRYDRLEAAKRNAKNHGYQGAMFPWESAATGEEETPIWALSGPFEHHITACVAIAAWNYYQVTQDTAWLRTKGWPILSETANFWVSRVKLNKEGKYDIKNVVGADEWAENVDNDAWTNAAAKANLRYAAKAGRVLNEDINSKWEQIADAITILKFEDGVTQEHAAYEGELIKQADVNLLAYPLSEVTAPAEILKDLEYYQTKVPEVAVPAMTKSIFALLYARLGDSEKAYEVFLDSYQPNLWGPFKVIMETPESYNPYFATAAGGVLQAMLMGFGGLEISDGGIVQGDVVLPKKWKKITIKGVGNDDKTFIVENK